MTHSNFIRAVLLGAAIGTAVAAPAAAQVNSAGDIILHAQRASVMSGAWSLVSDSTAADGLRLSNPDAGRAKLTTPLASPTDYFELTFTPQANRGYRLWIRGKAANDAWTNDSVFVQFTSSVNQSGSAVYRIGSTSATIYSVEEGSGAGLLGWGWQDNAYGGLGDPIYFSGATEKIRVQAREDGISIDQIVLSPVTYFTTAPGLGKNDSTIIPEPGSTTTSPAPSATTTGAWGSLINASASGMTIRKSSGCGDCPDAGGVITTPITGSVSFTVATGQTLVAGLNTDSGSTTGYSLKYAFSFSGSSSYSIREGGVYKTEGSFSSSDVFKVGIEGSTVKYYRNGSVVYTSATPVPGTLYADTTLVSSGATLTITALNGTSSGTTSPPPSSTGGAVTWTSLVKTTASGGTLTKTSGCGDCPDAGAISQQLVGSGGSVSFKVGSGQYLTVGLGADRSSSTSPSFDYGFSFTGGSSWSIREFGVYKTEGSFSSSDTFTIAVEGTAVRYYRNGALVYTSSTAAPGTLVVDTTLWSIGATVSVTALTAGTTTTAPAPSPTPTPTGSTLRVLQWNLHHGGFGTDGVYDTDRVANWIVNMQPDVVMLNEIEKYTGWGNQDQPAIYKNLLQQKTGKTWYSMFAQEFGDWNANGKGNMILSTYPLSYTARYELVHNYDRSVGLATITVNSRPITLMVTHLDPYDATLRLAQATEVTTWAAPQPENRIITGDMNAWPDQTSIAHFNTYYYDSWTVALSKGTATAFSGNNGETKNGRIDYIFYSKGAGNLVVQSSRVYDTRDANGVMPSDHRPVLTQFEVR
jgi:endonuclease/exonuclease/phosphatase family metal-dependent hydrolase